jgi:hypothetical protein
MVSEQVKPRDVEAIIKRRELLRTALLGSAAFAGLAPILARGAGAHQGGRLVLYGDRVGNKLLKKEVKGLNVRVLAK